VPDGRFYTKANFFTLRNHSREGVISEQYQTDAEPGEQEVFEEMMQRRNRLGQAGVVQAPAVPGDSQQRMFQHSKQMLIQSPPADGGGGDVRSRTLHAGGNSRRAYEDDMNRTGDMNASGFPSASNRQARLQPISETDPVNSSFYANQ